MRKHRRETGGVAAECSTPTTMMKEQLLPAEVNVAMTQNLYIPRIALSTSVSSKL